MEHNAKGAFMLTKTEIKALIQFTAKPSDRPHLARVAFEPSKKRAYATDGNTLAVATCLCGYTDDPTPRFTVDRAYLENAVRSCRRKTDSVLIYKSPESETVRVRVITEDGQPDIVTDVPTEETFPEIDQVIVPKEIPAASITEFAIDPNLLARMKHVSLATGSIGMRFRAPSDPLDPIRLDMEGESTQWSAIMMPVRLN